MDVLVTTLLRYLRSDRSAYHVRVVALIWALDGVSRHSYIESILAQNMTSPVVGTIQEAYEVFGVLWRLTGVLFTVPFSYSY
jgi:hypothetical protein